MNNNNNRRYVTMASGWLKEGNKGQYISAAVDKKVKISVTLEDGTQVPVSNFAVFFTENKKTSTAPDVRFTFTVEE